MIITGDKTKKTIKTIFPKDKFTNICNTLGCKNVNDPLAHNYNINDIKKVFIKSIEYFIDGNLDLDEFSNISNNLFAKFVKIERAEGDLSSALYAGAELSYYARLIHNDSFGKFKDKVLEYYNKYSG